MSNLHVVVCVYLPVNLFCCCLSSTPLTCLSAILHCFVHGLGYQHCCYTHHHKFKGPRSDKWRIITQQQQHHKQHTTMIKKLKQPVKSPDDEFPTTTQLCLWPYLPSTINSKVPEPMENYHATTTPRTNNKDKKVETTCEFSR